jgi:hypothetical protein
MASLYGAPDAPTRLRSAVEIGFLALGALVAVGVAMLFLTLTGASRISYAPRPKSPRYVPLRQYPARCVSFAASGRRWSPSARLPRDVGSRRSEGF